MEHEYTKHNGTAFHLAIVVGSDISETTFSILMECISYVMIGIAALGLAGNVLIIVTYLEIGFSESINISYFALSVSDILSIIFITWSAICFIPTFVDSEMPFIPREFVIPTGGHTTAMFQKTTAWITAYISLERCLCVVFPLKIKAIAMPRRTVVVISVIFSFAVLPLAVIAFYTYVFEFKFDAPSNKTLLRVTYRKSPLSDALTSFNYIYKLVFMNFTSFGIVLVCAVVLAIQLNRSALWRLEKSSGGNIKTGASFESGEKAQRKYAKDVRVTQTVLAIATTFIFTGTFSTIKYVIAMTWPGFHPMGVYTKLFTFTSMLEFLVSLANSSVNFIIYYRMGTKFRATVNRIILRDKER